MHGEGPKRIYLKATGPGEVTAGQIETGHDIEVMNPDLVICTLDDGAKLSMEMTVETGKGYVAGSLSRAPDAPIGHIPVDALFSPVRKVSYRVENTRVGQRTDYDKLSMRVETNGAVTPEDSVALAARILQDQLQLFINFEEPTVERPEEPASELPFNKHLLRRSTSSSCRCARPTASRTTTSSISATWCRRPRRRCCARRISAASRSTRSKRSWRRWGCIWG
jgi:DNA-directed RNA polymerase subunit alpha